MNLIAKTVSPGPGVIGSDPWIIGFCYMSVLEIALFSNKTNDDSLSTTGSGHSK